MFWHFKHFIYHFIIFIYGLTHFYHRLPAKSLILQRNKRTTSHCVHHLYHLEVFFLINVVCRKFNFSNTKTISCLLSLLSHSQLVLSTEGSVDSVGHAMAPTDRSLDFLCCSSLRVVPHYRLKVWGHNCTHTAWVWVWVNNNQLFVFSPAKAWFFSHSGCLSLRYPALCWYYMWR